MKLALLNINPVARCLGISFKKMTIEISHLSDCPREGNSDLCTLVHSAGFEPNIMHRFMRCDLHEVLLVN